MKKQLFAGSGVRLAIPFDGDAPDYDALDALLDRLLEAGTDAILVGGGWHEGTLPLPPPQRLDLLEHCVKRVNRRITVLAEVAGDSAGANAYTREAGIRGADGLFLEMPDALAAHPEQLVGYYCQVVDAAGLPAIVQSSLADLPAFGLDEYRKLAENPLILAELMEYSSISNLTTMAEACKGEFSFFAGDEMVILPVLSLGGGGVITRLGNLFPQDLRDLCHLYFMGRLQDALAIQLQLVPQIQATQGMDDKQLLDYGRSQGLL